MTLAVAEDAKQANEVNVVVKKVDETDIKDWLNADGIIMGSPTYYGQMFAKLKALIDKSVKIHGKLEGKVGAALTSSCGKARGAETILFLTRGQTHSTHVDLVLSFLIRATPRNFLVDSDNFLLSNHLPLQQFF